MNQTPIRKTRRAAAMALAFATVMSLMGVSQANHTNCTQAGQNFPQNGGNATYCPEFSPGFTYTIRYPYRDTPAAFQIEVSQARHESLPLLTEVYYPRGWQFSVGSIRPSSAATCTAALPANVTNASLASSPIEALTNAVGMRVYEGASGTRNLGRASTTKAAGNAMIGFLNWDGSYSAPGVQGRATLCLAMDGGINDVRETIYLDALTDDPTYGWRLTVDTGRILDPANGYVAADAGMAYFDIDFNDTTMGNWHLVNNIKSRAVWSRANRVPTQTAWKAELTTCRSGVASNGYALSGCPAAHRFPVSHTQPFVVSQPPAIQAQAFAQISSAGGVAIPGSGDSHIGNPQPVSGFGYSDANELNGGTTIPVKWNVPSTAEAEVTGFAVAIAEITSDYDPTNQDAEIAAGRLRYERFSRADACGTANTCAVNLDVSSLTPNNGTMDGKYNIGLVTIYRAGAHEGYRSDGLCDGVLSGESMADTGRGVLCPADRPAWLLGNPQNKKGADRYQVVVRQQDWPNRYLISNPLSLLLMDTVSGNAEYYIWGATQAGGIPPRRSNLRRDIGPGERYTSASNLVVNPTSPTTAAFVWGKMNLDQDWSYSLQIVGEIGVPGRPFYAQFHEWWSGWADMDWVDLPGINPNDPTNPTLCIDRPCGSSEGPPHMIITELSGSSF
jgi:hypothetical protein